MDQLQKDFADINVMFEANRRANYHRAKQEYESERDAEVIAELRRRLRLEVESKRAWQIVSIPLIVAIGAVVVSNVVAYLGAR